MVARDEVRREARPRLGDRGREGDRGARRRRGARTRRHVEGVLGEGQFDVVDRRHADATELVDEVARHVHVDQRVVAALDDEERRGFDVQAVVGRQAAVEILVADVGTLDDAPLEQDQEPPTESVPVGLVARHLEHSVEGDATAHRPVRDALAVRGSPRRVLARQCEQRREVTARRTARDHDALGVAAVDLDVLLYPPERARDVLDLGRPGMSRGEAVVARDRDPPAANEFVQHRSALFALVAERPRATVDVEDHRRVARRRREAPDVETVAPLGPVGDVAHYLHVAGMEGDLQGGPPPRAEVVVTRPRALQGSTLTGLERPSHDASRVEGNGDERQVLDDDQCGEAEHEVPEPLRARPTPPPEQEHQCPLGDHGLGRKFARGPTHRVGQRGEDSVSAGSKGRERGQQQPRGRDRNEVGHPTIVVATSLGGQTP